MRRSSISPIFLVIVLVLAAESIIGGGSQSPMDWIMNKLLIVPGIIIGLSFHEFAHAFAASRLGDNTPVNQGRVTINPMAHIDWIGLAALFFCGFGWGVPVQINPYNFKHRRRDELIVATAGIAMNFLMAIAFAFIAKLLIMTLGYTWLTTAGLGNTIWLIVVYIIQINLVLMIFNLIPCPPLDGFNIIAQIGNFGQSELYWKIYRYGNMILVLIIITGITSRIISPCVNYIMNLIWEVILF